VRKYERKEKRLGANEVSKIQMEYSSYCRFLRNHVFSPRFDKFFYVALPPILSLALGTRSIQMGEKKERQKQYPKKVCFIVIPTDTAAGRVGEDEEKVSGRFRRCKIKRPKD
jgi:hypothetical protein